MLYAAALVGWEFGETLHQAPAEHLLMGSLMLSSQIVKSRGVVLPTDLRAGQARNSRARIHISPAIEAKKPRDRRTSSEANPSYIK